MKWIFLPARKQAGNAHGSGCRAALPSNSLGAGNVASLPACGLSRALGLPTVLRRCAGFLKICSQNRKKKKKVEMETRNPPSESKLERFLVQFAVAFPVMMTVSHLNLLMHLSFSQATGKLLQQICGRLATSGFAAAAQ